MQNWIIIAVIAVVVVFFLVRRKTEPEAEEPAAVILPAIKTETELSAHWGEEISPAIIAAITAAVTLVTGQPSSTINFRSIRPLGNTEALPMWAFMGSADIMTTRQSYLERRGK